MSWRSRRDQLFIDSSQCYLQHETYLSSTIFKGRINRRVSRPTCPPAVLTKTASIIVDLQRLQGLAACYHQ